MEEQLSFDNQEGDSIAAVISIPEKHNGNAVILLHCFCCSKFHRVMRHLSAALNKKGFSTLRFDFSGCGESGGKLEEATYTKMLGEAKAAADLLEKKGMKKIGVAGHSLGAMMGLLAAHHDERLEAVAFIAGSSQAARVREVFPQDAITEAEEKGHSKAVVYGRDMKLTREFLHDIDRHNVGHAVASLNRPLLVVHGTVDDIIESHHARKLHLWANHPKKIEYIKGADHLFKDNSHLDEMTKKVAVWFYENL
jgi:putative redox protein